MSPYKRGMIFITFLGSCLCIGLLAAALGTEYWLTSKAKRRPEKAVNGSDGDIHFGLFHGQQKLNVGYGWRNGTMNIEQILRTDPDFMIYALWQSTIYCMYFALLFTTAAAIFAVVNSAITPVGDIMGIPGLYMWNVISIIFQISAVSCWAAQYYKKLRYNVILAEDRKIHWSSNGMAYYGHSFWLVVASIIIQAINLIFIYSGTSELRHKKSSGPVIEEKTNGAIMLY